MPYAALIGVQWRVDEFATAAEAPQIARDAEELYDEIHDVFATHGGGPQYVVLHLVRAEPHRPTARCDRSRPLLQAPLQNQPRPVTATTTD